MEYAYTQENTTNEGIQTKKQTHIINMQNC